MIINPIITPPPADNSAWATRAVLGEERWLVDHPPDRIAAINAANAITLLATIVPARKKNKPLTILGVAASMSLTLVSWNLYADYYEQLSSRRAQLLESKDHKRQANDGKADQ